MWWSNNTGGAWVPEDSEEQGCHTSPIGRARHLGENRNWTLFGPHYHGGLSVTTLTLTVTERSCTLGTRTRTLGGEPNRARQGPKDDPAG